MDALLGLVGLFGAAVALGLLFINFIRKKPNKKVKRALIIFIALFFTGMGMSILNGNQDTSVVKEHEVEKTKEKDKQKKFDNYKLYSHEWGEVLAEKLQEIGVENVRSIKTDGDYDYTVLVDIETEKTNLHAQLGYGHAGFNQNNKPIDEWYVYEITEEDNRDIVFYYKYSDEEEKPTFDLYDYRTGNILIAADPEAKAKREEEARENLQRIQAPTKDEKVDNLMIIVDSWNGKYTSEKFRDEIVSYLDLPAYDTKGFESYEFGFVSTVVWGIKDNPEKILIMSNFNVRVYENYDFITNKDNYSKVKRVTKYPEDGILYNDYNYEAYAIQDINTGEVELISQDEYTSELKNKDETFRKIY